MSHNVFFRTPFVFLLLTCRIVWAGNLPTAHVLEHVDQWTETAEATTLLREAGFQVELLPLDCSPAELETDLIVLGSFATEHPGYSAYMTRFGVALRAFVRSGHTLLQLTQTDQVEARPPFLPSSLAARRNDRDLTVARVYSPTHPLLKNIAQPNDLLVLHQSRTVWETFEDQVGFQVILAGDAEAQIPVLIEAEHGEGRFILCAMALDKVIAPVSENKEHAQVFDAGRRDFALGFFRNLAQHVVAVRDGSAPAVVVTPSPRVPHDFVPGSWTLAVLPDTQMYALRYPGVFTAQTGWILQHRERLNIKHVLHLGDVVNNNTSREWGHARDAFSLLDGVVPYAIAPGNHDYGPNGSAATRDTLFNEYFPYQNLAAQPTFGGAMEAGVLDNTYHLFDAGEIAWIVLALEWAPRDETIAWANRVMDEHADRRGILITHAYLNNNDHRYDHADEEHPQAHNPHHYETPGRLNDGEQLWQKLVRKHDFPLVLNGHVLGDGTGYLASTNDHGRTCHQMLSNYQMRSLGGEGFLRLLEFHPDGKTVHVKSYSPVFDAHLVEADQQFTIELD